MIPEAVTFTMSPGQVQAGGLADVVFTAQNTTFTALGNSANIGAGPGVTFSNIQFDAAQIRARMTVQKFASVNRRNVSLTFPSGLVLEVANALNITSRCKGGFIQATPSADAELKPGECLLAGTQTVLDMQDDGNLVLYEAGAAKWASNSHPACNGASGSDKCRLVLQRDGNLVIYRGGSVVWSPNVFENGGPDSYTLVLSTRPQVVLYRGPRSQPQEPTWASWPNYAMGFRPVTDQQERSVYLMAKLSQILSDEQGGRYPLSIDQKFEESGALVQIETRIRGRVSALLGVTDSDIRVRQFGDANHAPDQLMLFVKTGNTWAVVLRGTRGPKDGCSWIDGVPVLGNLVSSAGCSIGWKINYYGFPSPIERNFSPALVHPGWAAVVNENDPFNAIREIVLDRRSQQPQPRILFGGHSQGGALMGYSLYRLLGEGILREQDMLVTFGAPHYAAQALDVHVFNDNFRDWLRNSQAVHYPVEFRDPQDPVPFAWSDRFGSVVEQAYAPDANKIYYGQAEAGFIPDARSPHDMSNYVTIAAERLLRRAGYSRASGKQLWQDGVVLDRNRPALFLPRNPY